MAYQKWLFSAQTRNCCRGNCSGCFGSGGPAHIGGCEIGEDTILSSRDTGGIPEAAVFCNDTKFAVGGTVVVTLEMKDWHVGGCKLSYL